MNPIKKANNTILPFALAGLLLTACGGGGGAAPGNPGTPTPFQNSLAMKDACTPTNSVGSIDPSLYTMDQSTNDVSNGVSNTRSQVCAAAGTDTSTGANSAEANVGSNTFSVLYKNNTPKTGPMGNAYLEPGSTTYKVSGPINGGFANLSTTYTPNNYYTTAASTINNTQMPTSITYGYTSPQGIGTADLGSGTTTITSCNISAAPGGNMPLLNLSNDPLVNILNNGSSSNHTALITLTDSNGKVKTFGINDGNISGVQTICVEAVTDFLKTLPVANSATFSANADARTKNMIQIYLNQ